MGVPTTDITWLLVIIGAITTITGLWLLKRGRWPRRVGDTPHCPRCDYILPGLGAATCPGGGTQTGAARIVRGERHPRRGLATFGALIFLLGLLIAGVGLTRI